MAKKKVKKTKKYGHLLQRLKQLGFFAALCLVLCLVLYLLSAFVLFKISAIDVVGPTDENGNSASGSSFYTYEQVVAASGVNIGDSLVNISAKNIAAAIEKNLPYIGSVTVKREFPSTLKLTVEDSSTYFAVESGAYILLNRDYKVLGADSEMPKNCAIIVGDSLKKASPGEIAEFEEEATKTRINMLVSAFDNEGLTGLTKIDLSNIAGVKVVLNNRITITIGTLTNLEKKLNTVRKTIKEELSNNPNARILIDVTDESYAYVRDDKTPYEEETDEWTTDIPVNDMDVDGADTPNDNDYNPDGVG